MKITKRQLNKIIKRNLNEIHTDEWEAEVTHHQTALADAIELAMNSLGETWVLNFLRSYTANY